MRYILPTPHGYYFRLAIPTDLRHHFRKRELKKPLKTAEKKVAIGRAIKLAAGAFSLFERLRDMAKFPYAPEMVINGFKRLPDGTITFDHVQTDPANPQDADDLIKFLNARAVMPVTSGSPSLQTGQQTLTSNAVKQYVDEKVATESWNSKTKSEQEYAFRMLIKVAGDLPVSAVDYVVAASFFQTLKKLPSNMNKSPLYRGKSVQQVLAAKPTEILKPATINKIMERVEAFWAWCIRHSMATINPFTDLKLKKKSLASSSRSAFTNSEVKALLPHFDQMQPARYWVTLIAAYTGMRQNEICQLHTADIRKIGGVWVIDVNDRDGKKLKNLYSARLVPVHDKLMQLGFLDYVTKAKAQKSPQLFPELKNGRDGHGREISRWFAKHRASVGISERGKDFHSFRHTLITQLKNADVPESVAAALVGHSTDGITYSTYGKAYFLKTLKKAIQKVSY